MNGSRFLSVTLLALLAACSGAPPALTAVNTRKNLAADNLRYGNQAFDLGDYEKALQFYLLALESNTAADFEEGIVKSYHSIARSFLALNRLDQAANALANAERVVAILNDPTLEAQQLFHQASLELERGRLDRASLALEKALALNDRTGDRAQRALLLHGMGRVQRARGMAGGGAAAYREALVRFRQAQALNEALAAYAELATNHYMQGLTHLSLEELDLAEAQLLKALEYDRRMEISLGIAMDHRALGQVAARRNDWGRAADHYLRSYRVLVVLGLESQQARALDLLIEALVKSNRTDEAETFRRERSRLNG